MPVWARAFLILMKAFFTMRLVSSVRTGTAKASMFRYDRKSEPTYFWFFVTLFFLGSIWSWGLFFLLVWHRLPSLMHLAS